MCGIDNSMNIKKGLKRIHIVIVILSILLGFLFYYLDYENRKSNADFEHKVSLFKQAEKKYYDYVEWMKSSDDIKFLNDKANEEWLNSRFLGQQELYFEYMAQRDALILLDENLKKPNTEFIYKYSVIISLIVILPYFLFFFYKFIFFRVINYLKDGFKDD